MKPTKPKIEITQSESGDYVTAQLIDTRLHASIMIVAYGKAPKIVQSAVEAAFEALKRG